MSFLVLEKIKQNRKDSLFCLPMIIKYCWLWLSKNDVQPNFRKNSWSLAKCYYIIRFFKIDLLFIKRSLIWSWGDKLRTKRIQCTGNVILTMKNANWNYEWNKIALRVQVVLKIKFVYSGWSRIYTCLMHLLSYFVGYSLFQDSWIFKTPHSFENLK